MSIIKSYQNLRAEAARIIYEVEHGSSLAELLPNTFKFFSDSRDQRLIQAICYGVCRWHHRLNALIKLLLTKPLKDKDREIHCLLLVGLYQLIELRIPPHAIVAETVAATNDFKKPWAKSLVNAVLRRFIRERTTLEEKINHIPQAFYSHPEWMLKKIKQNWPSDWEAILQANNQQPPFSLRINLSQVPREIYLQRLASIGEVHPSAHTKSGITLTEPIDVKQLPGFLEGDVSVQDGAAQLAAELLCISSKQRILDACAAPGGKTAHILEIAANKSLTEVEVWAIDSDAKRLQKVQDNLSRLKLSASCLAADAGDLPTWWDGRQFDRVLLDAPCSASGVIRRHPDIKLLRRATDLAKLAETQLRLLNALWTVLVPGGLLLYVTCSIFPEENMGVISQFLDEHPEAKEEKIAAEWGKECPIGRQILPGMHGMDGFYFAILRK